jgi:hypothetical protein
MIGVSAEVFPENRGASDAITARPVRLGVDRVAIHGPHVTAAAGAPRPTIGGFRKCCIISRFTIRPAGTAELSGVIPVDKCLKYKVFFSVPRYSVLPLEAINCRLRDGSGQGKLRETEAPPPHRTELTCEPIRPGLCGDQVCLTGERRFSPDWW